MRFLKEMEGVSCLGTSTGNAFLYRNESGRLVIIGNHIDVFALLHWIELNPLAQFRQIEDDLGDFKPHHMFEHLFNEQGQVK